MTALSRLASFWKNMFHRQQVERDLDDELHAYVDLLSEEKVRAGMNPAEARRAAAIEAGGVEQIKEEVRNVRVGALLETVLRDLRYALRSLKRSPGFAAGVVLSLGLGIGTDITMLGLADSLLFQPPAYVRDVRDLVDVRVRTYPDYVDLRDQAHSFSGVAGWYAPPRPYAISDGARVLPVQQMLASASLFPVLGVRPFLGRFYDPREDRPGGSHVAILGYGLWKRQFAGARNVLGRTLRVAGDLYTIIGVAPEGFTGLAFTHVDLFLPITTTKFDAGPAALTSRDYSWLRVVGRLAPGATLAGAQAEARVIFRRSNPPDSVPSWQIAYLGGQPADVHSVMDLRREMAAANTPITLWLAAVATAVLLIACANVAGLMLARAVATRRELAVRAALGASRRRLLGALLLESTVLAVAGGVVGVIASRWGDALIRGLLLTDLAPTASPFHWRLLALGLAVTSATAAICWVGASVSAVRGNLALELANGARSVSPSHARARRLLLILQLALATVLVVGAALFTASLRSARAVDLGMSLDSVLISDLDLAGAGYTPGRAHALIDPITERLMAIPGVHSVALSDAAIPPGFLTWGYSVPGKDSLPRIRANRGRRCFTAVTSEFLPTLGTPIVRGRDFTPADRRARVIIVSQAFADLYWPGENPIGQCVKDAGSASQCLEVIGVAHNRRPAPGDTTALLEAFVPLGSPAEPQDLARLFPLASVALRVDGNVAHLAQRALEELLPDAPAVRVRPANSLFDRAVRTWRLGASLFTAFGAMGVALAVLGVYSVLAYLIAQRRREIAIRTALGATASDVRRLILGDTLQTTAVGLVLGIIAALVFGRGVRRLLFGVSPLNPVVYIGAALVLLLASLAAAAGPIRRAVGSDATVALRDG